jgi:3-dehydroquinate synthase
VIVDVDTLSTLDAREMSCGLAECIKHGIIGDADLFHWTREHLDALLGGDTEKLQELIARNVGFKAGVVQRDETEQGERALLNLGHTFGHAIEGTGGAGTYKHGEAIAIGAVAATRFAVEAGMCEASVLGEVESAFASARLPTRLSLDTPVETLLAEMHKDKKNKRQKLALILPKRIGECVMVRDVREDRVRQAWNYVRQG